MSQAGITKVSDHIIPGDVLRQITTDDNLVVVPVNSNVYLSGGTGIHTVKAATDRAQINVVRDGFAWAEPVGSIGVSAQTATICSGLMTITLPLTAGLSLGDTVIIYADTSSQVTIQTQADQFIQIGNDTSIVGGTAISTSLGAMVKLFFRPSDLTWHSIATMGTWLVQTT